MTIDPQELMGRFESETLEFKAVDILKNPAKVAREVVGFLNHKGGKVWIGVQEEDGRAVPPLQTVEDAAKVKDALRDYLVSTIEPPYQHEVRLELVPHDGGNLLLIVVEKGNRSPYAHHDKGRYFLRRTDSRLREMAWDEIFAGHVSPTDDALAGTIRDLREAGQQELRKEPPRLWLRLQPIPPLAIDFDSDATKAKFGTWLTDATSTGNRLGGSHFALRTQEPRWRGKVSVAIGDSKIPWTIEVTSEGRLTFALTSEALFPSFRPGDRDIVVFRLLELPTSVFRFEREILKAYGDKPGLHVAASMTIGGLRDARLVPGSPREAFLPWLKPQTLEHGELELDPSRLVFSREDLVKNADRCARDLARLVYYEFGFDDRAIPPEFDPANGLNIP